MPLMLALNDLLCLVNDLLPVYLFVLAEIVHGGHEGLLFLPHPWRRPVLGDQVMATKSASKLDGTSSCVEKYYIPGKRSCVSNVIEISHSWLSLRKKKGRREAFWKYQQQFQPICWNWFSCRFDFQQDEHWRLFTKSWRHMLSISFTNFLNLGKHKEQHSVPQSNIDPHIRVHVPVNLFPSISVAYCKATQFSCESNILCHHHLCLSPVWWLIITYVCPPYTRYTSFWDLPVYCTFADTKC